MNGRIKRLIQWLQEDNNITKYYYVQWPNSSYFIDDENSYRVLGGDEPDMMVPTETYEMRCGLGNRMITGTKFILIDWPESQKYADDPEAVLLEETNGIMIPYKP